MKKAIFIGACLGLAACGTAPDAPKKEEPAKAATPARMKLGEYVITLETSKIDVPGMPAADLAEMKKTMGKTGVLSHCLKTQAVEPALKEMLSAINGNCSYPRFSAANGVVDGETLCKTAASTNSMTAAFSGKYADVGASLDMDVAITDPSLPQGTSRITSKATMQHIGACKKQ